MRVRSHRKKTSLLFHEIDVYRPLIEWHKVTKALCFVRAPDVLSEAWGGGPS